MLTCSSAPAGTRTTSSQGNPPRSQSWQSVMLSCRVMSRPKSSKKVPAGHSVQFADPRVAEYWPGKREACTIVTTATTKPNGDKVCEWKHTRAHTHTHTHTRKQPNTMLPKSLDTTPHHPEHHPEHHPSALSQSHHLPDRWRSPSPLLLPRKFLRPPQQIKRKMSHPV